MIVYDLNRPETFTATFTVSRGSAELTLRRPKSSENMDVALRSRMGSGNPNSEELVKSVANKWWVDFSGICDREGTPVPNTPDARMALLQSSETLLAFILAQLRAQADQDAEGNAGSASV